MNKIDFRFQKKMTDTKMYTLSTLPTEFRGDLYNELIQNDREDDVAFPMTLKVDLILANLTDILATVETCAYLACDLPPAVFEFIEKDHYALLLEIEKYKKGNAKYQEYQFFVTTPEFKAVEIYAIICMTYPVHSLRLKLAVEKGSVMVVKYIERVEKIQYNDSYIIHACQCGSLEILKYWEKAEWYSEIIANKYMQERMCAVAASGKHLRTLIYLRETLHFQWSITTMNACISHQATTCLQYILKNGCQIDIFSMRIAIATGNLEIIKILHVAGAELCDQHTTRASQLGYVDVLHYLHANGCP